MSMNDRENGFNYMHVKTCSGADFACFHPRKQS